MKRYLTILLLVAAALCATDAAQARRLNDKIQNRPYADLRRWHLGFSVGVHTQNTNFTHNGIPTEQGETWYVEQPSYSPGFCVNGLFDWRLNTYFSLRVSPGMYFGNRDLRMREISTGTQIRQNIKTALVVAPVDIKFSSLRYRNCRPYMLAGVMPAFDVSKKRSDEIRLKSTDVYLSVGFGCDFYLPYFKLNPEIKFCIGLTDALQHDRPDLADDPAKLKYTQALKRATSKMIVLTFYFE